MATVLFVVAGKQRTRDRPLGVAGCAGETVGSLVVISTVVRNARFSASSTSSSSSRAPNLDLRTLPASYCTLRSLSSETCSRPHAGLRAALLASAPHPPPPMDDRPVTVTGQYYRPWKSGAAIFSVLRDMYTARMRVELRTVLLRRIHSRQQ
jgi:hypothetical protein